MHLTIWLINLDKTQKTLIEKIMFWPDLASAHYANDTLVALEGKENPSNVPKENPPNVPQIRPIENFWANLKRKVYSNNYRPKDVKNLMAKIRKELKSPLKLQEFVRP
jgi:transposase